MIYAERVDRLFVYSNGQTDGPPVLVARKAQCKLRLENEAALPEVTARFQSLLKKSHEENQE